MDSACWAFVKEVLKKRKNTKRLDGEKKYTKMGEKMDIEDGSK